MARSVAIARGILAAAAGIAIVGKALVSQDVQANTFTNNGYKSCGLFGCNGSQTQSTITQRASMVSDTGDISIKVTDGDFVNRGSTLMALDGTLSISARDVKFETAAFEEINRSWASNFGLTGFSASKTTSTVIRLPQMGERFSDVPPDAGSLSHRAVEAARRRTSRV